MHIRQPDQARLQRPALRQEFIAVRSVCHLRGIILRHVSDWVFPNSVRLVWRQLIARCVLAELQRANVCGNRPAVLGADQITVRRHAAEAVRDHVEKWPSGICRAVAVDETWAATGNRACTTMPTSFS